ncbi:hypothetical protein BN135_4027 [Cronobacter muytjensii 530]
MTRRTTGATRHARIFAACLGAVIGRGWRLDVRRPRQGSRLFTRFGDRRLGVSLFDSLRNRLDTHFLAQLARFTARHHLNNAIFLFGLFHRLVTVQRADFLLRLTFLIRATTVAIAAGRLLLITGFGRFLRFFSHDRRAGFTRVGVLLLFLAAVAAVFFARFAVVTVIASVAVFTRRTLAAFATVVTVIAIATVVLATAVTTFLLLIVTVFRWLLLRLARGRLRLRFAGEQAFQRADSAAQEAFFRRLSGFRRRFRFGSGGFRRAGLLRHWRYVRHHEGGKRRLLRTFTLGVFIFRRQRHRFFMQLRQHVAQGVGLFAFTDAQYGVVRSFHLIVWHDHAAHAALALLDGGNRFTLLVKQVGGDRHRNDSVDFLGVLFQRFFFNQTQNGQRQGFVIADGAGAATTRADVMAGFAKRRAQTLAGHLQQAEARNMANLDTRAILTHRFAQTILYRALVAYRGHIDKVDNDKTAQVAQAQLAGDFIRRFQVGIERRLFDIAAAGGASGVDIDGGQRFGSVDNNRAAGRQTHFALEGRLNLGFDLVMAEQRDFTGVELNFAAEIRTTQRGDVLAGQLKHFRVINEDFADVLAQIVAERAHDNVTFLMDKERRRAVFCGFLDGFPVLQAEA